MRRQAQVALCGVDSRRKRYHLMQIAAWIWNVEQVSWCEITATLTMTHHCLYTVDARYLLSFRERSAAQLRKIKKLLNSVP